MNSVTDVPKELPFVVRSRARGVLLLSAAIFLPTQAIAAVVMGLLAVVVADVEDQDVRHLTFALITFFELSMIVLGATHTFLLWRLWAYRGVFLSVDTGGVWIRIQPWSRQLVRLPWEAIVMIRMRDPGTLGDVQVFGVSPHTPYRFRLLAVDRTADEILRALTYLSAGRVRIQIN